MKPSLFTICFFCGVLFSSLLFAESSIVETPVSAEKPEIIANAEKATARVFKKNSTNDDEQIIEMRLLKAKLEAMQSDQERFISTVFWLSNSFIAIFLSVLGISGTLKYVSDSNAKKIQEEALNNEREAAISEIKRESKEYMNKLKEEILKENVTPIATKVESFNTKINYELSKIKLHIHNDKREKYLNTGKFDIALNESIQELVTSLETGFGGFVKSALSKIAADLKSILELPPSGRNFGIHIRLLLDLIKAPLEDARVFSSIYDYKDINPLIETIEEMSKELLLESSES